jgi:hypothetical protein
MSEMTLGTLAVIALAICVLDCFFWMYGGREDTSKGWRRYIGAIVQTIGLNGIALIVGTWVWQYAASMIGEFISRSLGYGGDTTGEKIMRRTVFALGSLGAGAVLAWGLGFSGKALTVLVCQAVASVVSIILGIYNPVPAAVEETFVCMSLKYCNYLYIFVAL